jgi:vitamin B12 transporter
MYRGFISAACAASCLSPAISCAADQLAAVVVTATRQATRINEVLADVTVIEREAIEKLGSGTIAELLARQPGIQFNALGGPGSQTQILLRGARSEQTKIMIDGVAINSMDLQGSPLRFVSLADVERIEILRGPAGAVHGSDAIGGVIHIITRRPVQGASGEIFAGTGSYGTDKFAATISLADERWSARLSASDHRSDGYGSIKNATNRDGDSDGYRNRGSNFQLAFRPTAGHELALAGFTNRGQAQFDGTTGAGTFDSRYMFRNEVWNLTAKNRLAERWNSTLRWSHAIDEQNTYTSAGAAGYSPLRSTNRGLSWQNDIRLPLGQAIVVAETQGQHAAPADRFPRVRQARLDALQLGWSGSHAEHRWQFGARHDKHTQFGRAGTGSASYGYQFDEAWRAHLGTASAFRAPTLYQLYASIPGALVPNPSLQPEKARNLEFGVTREIGLHTVSWVTYRNRVSDMIDFDLTTSSYRNISRARLRGWTLMSQGTAGAWTYSASLDQLDAIDEATGLQLRRRAKQKGSLALDWQAGAWALGGELLLVGRRFNLDNETQAMGGYGLLNLTARWTIDTHTRLEVRADNVTDKSYTTALTSNGRFAYVVPGSSVFLGIRHSF